MSVKITISGDGLHFDGDMTLLKASQIIAFLGTETISSEQPYQRSITSAILDKPKTSPREALNDANAKTNPQKIAVIGKYLMDRDGVESFSAIEVRETLKKSGEPLPSNFSRDINDAVRYGYIYQSGKDKDYYSITDAAGDKIRSGFSEGDVSSAGKSQRKKKKGPSNNKPNIIRPDIQNLNLPERYKDVSYWNDKLNKGQRILWLLAIADENGTHDLFAQEIELLASKKRDNIPAKNVPALVMSHFKKDRIKTTNAGSYELLRPGIEYLVNIKNIQEEKE